MIISINVITGEQIELPDALCPPAYLLTAEEKRSLLTPLNPAQVRLALNKFGLLDTVEAAIKSGDKSLQIEWEFRTEFSRDNDLLLSMATALNITDTQLDDMFSMGASL